MAEIVSAVGWTVSNCGNVFWEFVEYSPIDIQPPGGAWAYRGGLIYYDAGQVDI